MKIEYFIATSLFMTSKNAAISWALEFIGGSIALVRYWLFQIQLGGEWVDRICSLYRLSDIIIY